ncbi:M48 family metalloprotease [Luteimonas sp. RIT-PG2_3]
MPASSKRQALIQRLETEARTSPGTYRLKLALLAAAGYAVLIALLLLVLAAPLAIAWRVFVDGVRPGPEIAYALLLPGLMAVVLVRALWIRFGEPDGHRLAPNEAPELQREIERLRREIGAPPLQGIHIDGELNAAAVYMPRMFGLLGHHHHLVLGLPLIALLERDELLAVIAHEFGHFGGQHGRFTGWIYRVRLSWYRVLEGLSGHSAVLSRLLGKFYGWYVPYFNAYSHVLARAHEYEADAASARAVGPAVAASALIRVEWGARRLHARFWPSVFARTSSQGHPPAMVLAQMQRALASEGDGAGAQIERLLQVARQAADPDDTHPPLAKRIEAMQASPRLLPRTQSALALLGDAAPAIERRLENAWREGVRAHWRARHDAAASERSRLAELDVAGSLTPEQQVEHARLAQRIRIDVDALPLFERALQAKPDSALALLQAGVLQLERGDADAGAARLHQALQRDAGTLRPLLVELDRLEADPDLDAATVAAVSALRAGIAPRIQAQQARDEVFAAGDTGGADRTAPRLQRHDVDAAGLQRLRRVLAREPRIARAWLVLRSPQMQEDAPHYLVLLDWKGSVAGEASALPQLAKAVDLPGELSVFTGSNAAGLARDVKDTGGEPVFVRGAR